MPGPLLVFESMTVCVYGVKTEPAEQQEKGHAPSGTYTD